MNAKPSVPEQPLRAPRNDYSSIHPPPIGGWRPSKTVSVVVPAYESQDTLDLLLAALTAQTYPAELLELVVVDDGSEPPLQLPELRPARTTIIPNRDVQWGIASAVDTAIGAAAGEIIMRLDADLVPAADHIEAHARWHHLADYLTVIGKVAFVDVDPRTLDPVAIRDAAEARSMRSLFGERIVGDDWEVALVKESGGVVEDEHRAFTIANGATISFSKGLYRDCGGLDKDMPLGSDTELGYRLAQEGAVFIADADAAVWHLGLSQMKSRRKAGKRFRHVFMSNRVPTLRHLRNHRGITWAVPYVEVVIPVQGASFESVRASVSAALGGSLSDVAAVLVGPWSSLGSERIAPLEDPLLDLRLIREAFRGDARVRCVEALPTISGPTPFRLAIMPGDVLAFDGIERIVAHANEQRVGRLEIAIPMREGGRRAVFERTAAYARARRVMRDGESLDAVVREVWGVGTCDGAAWFDSEPGALRPATAFALRREIDAHRRAIKRLERALAAKPSLARRLRRRLVRAADRVGIGQSLRSVVRGRRRH